MIQKSLLEIEANTCVRFSQDSNPNYINVTSNKPGCVSWVGYKGDGEQPMNLAYGCMDKGIIIHEFLHAIGFYHQQNSADRDIFVSINMTNVKQGEEHNFDKYSNAMVTNFGYKYDYDSIMHYGPKEFSTNGQPVIIARLSGAENMGQRKELSKTDIAKINKMYDCKQ